MGKIVGRGDTGADWGVVPLERSGFPAPAAIAAARAAMAGQDWPTSCAPEELTLAGRRVLRLAPEGAPRGRVLHIHGGGFRLGLPEMDCAFARQLADSCNVEVTLPQYRLAPEHPFPAGLNDALAVFDALPDDLPLVVIGASAGGALAAGLAALRGPRLAGLVLLSAWLDLRVDAPSYALNAASDPLFSRESAEMAAALYLQGEDPAHPLASPLLADPARFPPTLVNVGTGEVLRDDARRFAARLGAAGVAVQLQEVPGMDHVAVTRSADAPGAPETLAAICGFVDEACGAAPGARPR